MVALPALASGVGLALSLPPWGWWVLAFHAAGLLWWRLGGLRMRTRLWAGWLAGLGTEAVAGAALRGVGIPACIGSGRSAARQVLAAVSAPAGAAPTP